MRFSRTRISPSFADIRTPVLRSLRDDSRDGPAILPENRLQAGNWTADGAKHRWASIVQVERRHCQVQFFERISSNGGGESVPKDVRFWDEGRKARIIQERCRNLEVEAATGAIPAEGLSVGFPQH